MSTPIVLVVPEAAVVLAADARRGRLPADPAATPRLVRRRSHWIAFALVLSVITTVIVTCCCSELLSGSRSTTSGPGMSTSARAITTDVYAVEAGQLFTASVKTAVGDGAHHASGDCDSASGPGPGTAAPRDGAFTAAVDVPVDATSRDTVAAQPPSAVASVAVFRVPHLLCVMRT